MKKLKVVIIGASGYLGKSLYHKLIELDQYQVLGTCNTNKSDELLTINILKMQDIEKVVNLRPDIIIWTVMNQELELNISQVGLQKIIELLPNDVRFIYLSTTVGKGKDQTELTKTKFRNENEYLHNYINGKIQGERYVMNLLNFVIVRPGSIYGYGYQNQKDDRMIFLQNMYKKNEIFKRTDNLYASFVYIDDLCNGIIELLESDFIGIINVAGKDPVSHYHFNKHIANLMNINDEFITPEYKDEAIYHNLSSSLRENNLKSHIRDIIKDKSCCKNKLHISTDVY